MGRIMSGAGASLLFASLLALPFVPSLPAQSVPPPSPPWAFRTRASLDTAEVAPNLGLVLQLGMDVPVSPRVLANLDVRWHTQETRLSLGGRRRVRLDVDPLVLGAGVGFCF
jgi:OmpW family